MRKKDFKAMSGNMCRKNMRQSNAINKLVEQIESLAQLAGTEPPPALKVLKDAADKLPDLEVQDASE